MTNSYKKESGSRHKKLLVPLVALLLCAAAMVGVGYAALMSDVTNTGNVITSDGITLTITDGTDQASGKFDATFGFQSFTTDGFRVFHVDGVVNEPWTVGDGDKINTDEISSATLIINTRTTAKILINPTFTDRLGDLPAGAELSFKIAKDTGDYLTEDELTTGYTPKVGDNEFVIKVFVTIPPTTVHVDIDGITSITFNVNVTAVTA